MPTKSYLPFEMEYKVKSLRAKIFKGFLVYGIVVGFLSTWWSNIADSLFLFNIPGVLLGDSVYVLAIKCLGTLSAAQAYYSIPWIFRVPQVYVPVSIIFWGLLGLVIQLIYGLTRKGK